jgi:hypothetical protein
MVFSCPRFPERTIARDGRGPTQMELRECPSSSWPLGIFGGSRFSGSLGRWFATYHVAMALTNDIRGRKRSGSISSRETCTLFYF